MATDGSSSKDLIRQAKDSLRSRDSSPMPPVDVPAEEEEPPADHLTVTERMIEEGQIDRSSPPAPAPPRPPPPVARSAPEPYVPAPEPPRVAAQPPQSLPGVPMAKPRKGRVRRFFGWIVFIVIALSWIRMLSELGDTSDVVVTIGAALFITLIPAFIGFALVGAGIDPESEPTLAPEPEDEPRRGGFLRFIAWIILALTAFAWIVLVLSLIDDPSGIVGIVLGGLVTSLVPILIALILMSDGDALAAEEQDNPDID